MFFQHLKHGSINHQREVLYINQPSKRDKSTATWIQAKLCISNSNNLSKQKRRLHGHVIFFSCYPYLLFPYSSTIRPNNATAPSISIAKPLSQLPLLHPWPETNMIIYIIENEATGMQRKTIRRKLFLVLLLRFEYLPYLQTCLQPSFQSMEMKIL